MDIVYCGPFADAINEGTRYGHEGYAVQVLHDGTESRCWTTEFREYRAGCDCGWRGATIYPPTEAGENAAQDEWNANGNCMLVVGATYPAELKQVREIVSDMTLLIPGIGTQGGEIEQVVKAGLNADDAGLIISASRSVIFVEDPAEAARSLRDEINRYR